MQSIYMQWIDDADEPSTASVSKVSRSSLRVFFLVWHATRLASVLCTQKEAPSENRALYHAWFEHKTFCGRSGGHQSWPIEAAPVARPGLAQPSSANGTTTTIKDAVGFFVSASTHLHAPSCLLSKWPTTTDALLRHLFFNDSLTLVYPPPSAPLPPSPTCYHSTVCFGVLLYGLVSVDWFWIYDLYCVS